MSTLKSWKKAFNTQKGKKRKSKMPLMTVRVMTVRWRISGSERRWKRGGSIFKTDHSQNNFFLKFALLPIYIFLHVEIIILYFIPLPFITFSTPTPPILPLRFFSLPTLRFSSIFWAHRGRKPPSNPSTPCILTLSPPHDLNSSNICSS